MVIVYGTRFYGKVQACGRSFIGTRFFHIWYLPLVPVGTQLVFESTGDGNYRSIKAPFSLQSMVAGYLRVWGPLGIGAALVFGAKFFLDRRQSPLAFFGDPLPLVEEYSWLPWGVVSLLAVTILAFGWLGRLSAEEKRKRYVYARHAGYFVDPSTMGDARYGVRDDLIQSISDHVGGTFGSGGYRTATYPHGAWLDEALHPDQADPDVLGAAFTLARIEASLAEGASKAAFADAHGKLWRKIDALGAFSAPPV